LSNFQYYYNIKNSQYPFSSQACGGLFLMAVFLLQQDHQQQTTSFSHSTVRLIYGAFTAITLLGVIILALLRIPADEAQNRRRASALSEQLDQINPAENQQQQEEQSSHLEILSQSYLFIIPL
jgi:hypothetical protein